MNNVYVNKKKQEQKDKRNKMILAGGAVGAAAIVAVLGVTTAIKNTHSKVEDSYLSVSETDTIKNALGIRWPKRVIRMPL